jgi:hypothetical protein
VRAQKKPLHTGAVVALFARQVWHTKQQGYPSQDLATAALPLLLAPTCCCKYYQNCSVARFLKINLLNLHI